MDPTQLPTPLVLPARTHLALRELRGTVLHIVEGVVWLTEDAQGEDHFLFAGDSYRVQGSGSGLLVLEAEPLRHLPGDARIVIARVPMPSAAGRARR